MNSSWYTGSGDDGSTSLFGPERVSKSSPQPEAYGSVDEASAFLGLIRAQIDDKSAAILKRIQNDFYVIMAELASTPDKLSTIDRLDNDRLHWLETQIDLLAEEVEPVTDFVQSGDSKLGALIDVGRTVVRRAERR
ncbi:MAG: cob(I)yrinic acid a,c-diamide adenosyltransferase, partial [Chloroflexota bacterium]